MKDSTAENTVSAYIINCLPVCEIVVVFELLKEENMTSHENMK